MFALLMLGVLLLFCGSLMVGDQPLSAGQLWSVLTGEECDGIARSIVLDIRLTRTAVAALIGLALSVSGLMMQTVFQNPLADPYLLGVSSGAGLGVALFTLGAPLLGFSAASWVHSLGVVGAGWAGTVGVLLGVAVASRRIKNILGILIVGVMVGYIAGAMIQILQYASAAEQLKTFALWSMGSLGHITRVQLEIMLAFILAGTVLAVACIKPLNLLLLGEEYARTMGTNVRRAHALIFVSTALLSGTVTAFCGPIGFIGLAIPHVARMLFGNADHRVLLPASLLLGILSMLVCDMLARLFLLPINCITALLGIPIILWVIVKNLRLAK